MKHIRSKSVQNPRKSPAQILKDLGLSKDEVQKASLTMAGQTDKAKQLLNNLRYR